MDDAGEGIPVFQLVPTKSLGKQILDTGDTRGASGQKNRIHLLGRKPRTCYNFIDTGRYLAEVLLIDRLKLVLADFLVYTQIALRKADYGLILAGKLAFGLFDGLKEKKPVSACTNSSNIPKTKKSQHTPLLRRADTNLLAL